MHTHKHTHTHTRTHTQTHTHTHTHTHTQSYHNPFSRDTYDTSICCCQHKSQPAHLYTTAWRIFPFPQSPYAKHRNNKSAISSFYNRIYLWQLLRWQQSRSEQKTKNNPHTDSLLKVQSVFLPTYAVRVSALFRTDCNSQGSRDVGAQINLRNDGPIPPIILHLTAQVLQSVCSAIYISAPVMAMQRSAGRKHT